MKIKICGITNFEDAQVAVDNGADALGFIFYDKSKRFIDYNKAGEIISSLPFFVMKVGVFVNEHYSRVNILANQIGLNAVQIHGEESSFYCDKITHPVIKAFRVTSEFNYSILENFNKYTTLLDTYSEKEYGGTGTNFNWNNIPNELRNRIILAGGVGPDNIEQIKSEISPQAIDVSSSIEKAPGIKDRNKLIQLLKMAKG